MFTLPELPYSYDALNPVIDTETMTIHHTKHHQAYIDKLNAGVAGTEYADMSLDELIRQTRKLPEPIQTIVKNHGGGHRNHARFWKSMTPNGRAMSQRMTELVEASFGSVSAMKDAFIAKTSTHFGSGWGWIVINADHKLEVVTTANQENPLMDGYTTLIGCDVWEHAYYLAYQNRRADYLDARWTLIDWEYVESVI